MKAVAALLALVMLIGAPAGVAGRPRKGEAQARALFEQAMSAWREGRDDEAIERLSAAYALFPQPAFLYNLGQVHERKGERALAAETYRKYLAATGRTDAALEERIRRLLAPAVPPPEGRASEAPAPGRRREAGGPPTPVPFRMTGAATVPPSRVREPWPWVATGIAAAALATATTLAVVSRVHWAEAADLDRAEWTPARQRRMDDLKARVRRESIAADVCFGVTAAAGATALFLFLRPSRVSVAPAAAPDGSAALSVSAAF
ncbi:MAG: hypothetical protein FJ087_05280 [Deltaproteobacteria bacterium]|nr:hypothetical protein [Deltaproteobacteria bacterium]